MAAYAAERVIVGAATALQRLDEHVPGFRESNPDLPWRPLIGMRDIVSHAYDRIDLRIVWATLEQDLPILDKQIERIQDQQ
ncbi:HepT-like ribonuclease domain-containing protein [Pseudoclavibacter soli]|uniref:HepT-like ribonuclease domain-containing protein n=1 Tax=Pseudoclavibacter soli TaxID=452623 RepID=UPI0006843269